MLLTRSLFVKSFLVKIISAAPEPRFDIPLRQTKTRKKTSEFAPNNRPATIKRIKKLMVKNFIGFV